MITGAIRNKVDKIWTDIWAGGIANPLTVIEQLTYLMFIRSLDEKELENEEFENMNTALDPQPVGCSKDGTECRIRFIKKDWERNQRMQVHGGAVSGMMDTAMGMSIMAKSGRPVTTAELNVSFIRPFLGESFLIDTEILYMGRNLIRTRSTAYDEESGKLLASATANFAYVG